MLVHDFELILYVFVAIVHLMVPLTSPTVGNLMAIPLDSGSNACREVQLATQLAHFTEHMLLRGSTDYPVGAEFWRFLTANGGNLNGTTFHDRTVRLILVLMFYLMN